ncbi:1772_t:CDS:1, partial [Dentiscutata erythropus]
KKYEIKIFDINYQNMEYPLIITDDHNNTIAQLQQSDCCISSLSILIDNGGRHGIDFKYNTRHNSHVVGLRHYNLSYFTQNYCVGYIGITSTRSLKLHVGNITNNSIIDVVD